MNDLKLKKHEPLTGEVVYVGTVPLPGPRGGSTLTFQVKGQVGGEGMNDPWVQLVFDPYECESFDAGLARMADWLEAAARVCRGEPQTGVVMRYVAPRAG